MVIINNTKFIIIFILQIPVQSVLKFKLAHSSVCHNVTSIITINFLMIYYSTSILKCTKELKKYKYTCHIQ